MFVTITPRFRLLIDPFKAFLFLTRIIAKENNGLALL